MRLPLIDWHSLSAIGPGVGKGSIGVLVASQKNAQCFLVDPDTVFSPMWLAGTALVMGPFPRFYWEAGRWGHGLEEAVRWIRSL